MIEVPAAAVCADLFASRLDFLSIGTNDLIQYTLAIDRVDDEVNYLYDPLHPSVLRLVKMTIDAGRRADIPVTMCGEMAGDPRFTKLLLGFGLRMFSIDPKTLLEVKKKVYGRRNRGTIRRPGAGLQKHPGDPGRRHRAGPGVASVTTRLIGCSGIKYANLTASSLYPLPNEGAESPPEHHGRSD